MLKAKTESTWQLFLENIQFKVLTTVRKEIELNFDMLSEGRLKSEDSHLTAEHVLMFVQTALSKIA